MIVDERDREMLIKSISRDRGMMDPRLKMEWIQTLRCRKQAIGVLQRTDGSCCALGALLSLYPRRDKLFIEVETLLNNATGEYEEVFLFNGSEVELPDEVARWSGLTDKVLSEISDMNDSLVDDLKEVADILEAAL